MSEERAVEAARRTLVGFEAGINVFDPAGMLTDALTMARYLALSGAAERNRHMSEERTVEAARRFVNACGDTPPLRVPGEDALIFARALVALSGAAPNPAVERPQDIVEARRAAKAVYLAAEKSVADDLARIINGLADTIERLRAVERPADPTSDAQKAALAWLDYCEAPSHARTIKAMLKRPAGPRGWREAIEAAAKICDQTHQANLHSVGISMGSDMRAMTAHKLAQQIRALSPAPKDREGG